jgi:hypothetical protein
MPSVRQSILLISVAVICFLLGGIKGSIMSKCCATSPKILVLPLRVKKNMRLVDLSSVLEFSGIIAAIGFIGVGKLILKPPSAMPSFNLNPRSYHKVTGVPHRCSFLPRNKSMAPYTTLIYALLRAKPHAPLNNISSIAYFGRARSASSGSGGGGGGGGELLCSLFPALLHFLRAHRQPLHW